MCRSLSLVVILIASSMVLADDAEKSARRTAELEKAKQRATEARYELRYKFHKGEVIRSRVTHLATTETTITGNTLESKSRSISTKAWRITNVDEDGQFTFEHIVEDVDMWQQIGEREEVKYNSKTDEKAPLEYEEVQSTVGIVLATITVDAHGTLVDRSDKQNKMNLGLGQITIPLPAGEVKIGHQWTTPSEVWVRSPDGGAKRIKTRQLFTLESVKTDVATISVKTQVLTPVNDPKIDSQIVQQLTNGTIRFDMDLGRILSRQMDWDETVVGFSGAESALKYLARYTEDYLPPEKKVAAKP
jgi:hypothetical protein